jgi:signal transduction histidine kinase
VEEPDNLPQDIVSGEFRRNIYLTVKETLHNIVKHAQATEVLISIEITNRLILKIKDNGIGIDNTRGKPSGNGLFNMNTRIQGLNGHFEIVNSNGTQVNILVPLNL